MLACSETTAKTSRCSKLDYETKVKTPQVEDESPVMYLLCSIRRTENLFCFSSLVGAVSVLTGRGILNSEPLT
jgi:hypothetical protein